MGIEPITSGIPRSYLSTDGTMAANSDTKVPTEKAIVTYVAATAVTTEADPVVGAITGIVKADGAGSISAAVSGTDYAPATGIDAADIADGSVSNTEFQYIGTLSSDAQTQITGISNLVSSGTNPGHSHIVSAISPPGTEDALTGTYTPVIAALTDGMEVMCVAAGANTSTTPTFQYNALTAKTIVKGAATALVAGDIPAAGYSCHLRYRAATDQWQLINPAITALSVGTAAGTVAAGNDARFTYTMTFETGAFTTADSTTYYFGFFGYASSTTESARDVLVPYTGTVVGALVQFRTTAGSNETSTIYVRNVTTATEAAINAAVDLSGDFQAYNVGLNLAVTAGDYIVIKWITPEWATNPTNTYIHVHLYIQR